MKEKAILITPDFASARRSIDLEDSWKELTELSSSAGLLVMENIVTRQKSPNASLLVGSGKAEELRLLAQKHRADVVVFESDLSGSQQRNLEEILGVKTLDRTQLILDIFAQRARSTEGKLQVELAQLRYLLPRLSGKGIYLSRLGGGVGTRGPGEQKLEVDRRRIREKITRLSKDLKELQKRRLSGIEKKKEKNFPLLALVGYTNAGKSSLFNRLTSAGVLVADKLFATLDTTTRALDFAGNQKALLVDTVGFVNDLPHHLIESFKATLEETVHADLLLHVIDATKPRLSLFRQSVEKVLADLGVEEKKTLLVLNKADLLSPADRALLQKGEWAHASLVSAKTGEGIPELLERLQKLSSDKQNVREFFIPMERLKALSFLYRAGVVLERRDGVRGVHVTASLDSRSERLFRKELTRPSSST